MAPSRGPNHSRRKLEATSRGYPQRRGGAPNLEGARPYTPGVVEGDTQRSPGSDGSGGSVSYRPPTAGASAPLTLAAASRPARRSAPPGREAARGGLPIAREEPPESGPARSEVDDRGRRRATDRRVWGLAALVPVLLAGVGLLDSLPALFLLLAVGQAVVFVALGWHRKRLRSGPMLGALQVAPTSLGRAWFPLAWGLVLVAIFLGSPPLRLMVCLLFTCSVAAWPLARRNVDRVRITRELEPRARVGAPTSIVYRVANPTRVAAHGIVLRDGFGIVASPGVIEACFETVGARQDETARALLVFARRGRRRLRPVRVLSRFPISLFTVSCETSAPAEILVRPAEGRATSALLATLCGTAATATPVAVARRGEADPDGLREFRDGEDRRRIHWRTSARRGVLTYVERRDEGTRDVLVVLARSVGHGVDLHRRFERAVSVTATVLRACVRAGLPCALRLGDGRDGPRAAIRGRRGLEAALDALAEVPADGERRPGAALAAAMRRPGSLVIWVAADAASLPSRDLEAGGAERPLVLRADDPGLSRFVTRLP